MARVVIVSCKKIRDVLCVSCVKCFKAAQDRVGEFERYKDEPLDIVALGDCGDCPGLVMPKLALVNTIAKSMDRDYDVVHLGTCIVRATTTAACPIDVADLTERIKLVFGKDVVIGTHPW
ncbi:MAG: CGGC domain-containing protein [Bacillota bacterium]